MDHPLRALPAERRAVAFGLLAVATLAVGAWVLWEGQPLVTAAAPRGIVSFELAFDLHSAHAMMASWGVDGVASARRSLAVDGLFLVLYSTAIALGLVSLSASRAVTALAWAQWVAGACDAVENTALWLVLDGAGGGAALAAGIAASVKFALVAAGLVVLALLAAGRVRRGRRGP